MCCICGYSFLEEAKAALRDKRNFNYVSWSVINERDYSAFLRTEREMADERDDEVYMEAISKYVGLLFECPQCSRLMFVPARKNEKVFYRQEGRFVKKQELRVLRKD